MENITLETQNILLEAEIKRLREGIDKSIYDLANENIEDTEVVEEIRKSLLKLLVSDKDETTKYKCLLCNSVNTSALWEKRTEIEYGDGIYKMDSKDAKSCFFICPSCNAEPMFKDEILKVGGNEDGKRY